MFASFLRLFNSPTLGIDNWNSVPSLKQNATRLIVSWNSIKKDWPPINRLDDYSDSNFPFKVKLPNPENFTTMSVLDDSHSKPPTRIIASIDLTTKPNRKSSWLNDPYSTKFHDFSSSLSTSAQILANPTPTIQFTAVTIPDLSEAVRGEFSSLSDTTPSSLTATVQSDPIRIELPKEIESPSRHDHMEKSIAQTSRPFEPNNSTVISNTSDSSITIKLTTTSRPSGSPKPDLAQITIFQAEASKNVTDTIISQFQNDINQFQSTSHNTSGVSIFDSPTTISSLANQTDDPSKKLPSKIALNLANSSSSSSSSNKTTNRPLNNNSVNYSDVNISNSNNSSPTYTDNGKPNIRLSTKSPRSTTRVSSTTKVPQNSIKVKTLNSSKRPSTKADISLSNEWLSQIHHVTTQKPYVAKRDCGIRTMTRREGRVVGGRDSHLGEFPWSVLIRETTLLGFFVKTKCGGVLIDLKWVLTAAHCQPGMFGSLVVVVGEYDLQGKSSRLKPIIKKVKRMIIHRDYNPSNFDNDIALLELESPYQIQPHVVPICLPEKGKY